MPRPTSRPVWIISSLLTLLALSTTSLFAQDNPPAKPPSQPPPGAGGTDAPPQQRPPQRPNRPNRPGADPGNFPVPETVEVVRDVVFATAPGKDDKKIDLKMDCAYLKQSDGKPMPVIIYIHGGGWSGGSRNMGMPFTIAFAQGGYFACTIDYRLSGEAIFPAQVSDVKSAVRFIRANAEKLGIDPQRIGVWGHSAGGHLSAMLGVTGDVKDLEGDVGEKTGSSAVQAVVDVSGPTDLVRIAPLGNGGPMVSQFLGGSVREKEDVAKKASPVTYVDAKDAPFLIIQGGADNLVPTEQAEIMRDALKKANVEVEYLFVPEAGHGVLDRRAFAATAAFFDKHLGGHSVQALEELQQRLPNLGGGPPGAGPGGPGQRPRRPNGEAPGPTPPPAPAPAPAPATQPKSDG